MKRVCGGVAISAAIALALVVALVPAAPSQIVYPPVVLPEDPTLAASAIGAVVAANDGKPPATGGQLTRALARLGKFAQLPIPFSAVRLDSGLTHPRVVITPLAKGLGTADATAVNLSGRLFLAANMERTPEGGDPRVTSVEFISWNTQRRAFDFGVIEHMGGTSTPELRFVDGGRCFACHKNRGPILGGTPWSNSAHDDILRLALARDLQLAGANLPARGAFAVPPAAPRLSADRIDGMVLATPEAAAVDRGVRSGADLRVNRDTFRLMTRSPDGRKALVVLLSAIVAPGPLDPDDKAAKQVLDATFDKSFLAFAADWANLQKEAKPSVLTDTDPAGLLEASGVRTPLPPGLGLSVSVRTVTVPGLTGGGGSRWAARPTATTRTTVSVQPTLVTAEAAYSMGLARQTATARQSTDDLTATLAELDRYAAARSAGRHGLTSQTQPSNPKAFAKPPVKVPTRASGIVNAAMLANTIGLTEGDRKFLATALADAARRAGAPRVNAASLAKEVFEGPEFADVLAGGPLTDRDEFKDRFAAGLDAVLKANHGVPDGFAVNRREYASGPKYDPKAAAETVAAVVPTSACLRCHDVRASGKPRLFEPIPALAFDPFDKAGRETWVRTTAAKQRAETLARMQQRLATDADMPPEDAPEYDRFRVQEPAAFDEARGFLKTELEKARRR